MVSGGILSVRCNGPDYSETPYPNDPRQLAGSRMLPEHNRSNSADTSEVDHGHLPIIPFHRTWTNVQTRVAYHPPVACGDCHETNETVFSSINDDGFRCCRTTADQADRP